MDVMAALACAVHGDAGADPAPDPDDGDAAAIFAALLHGQLASPLPAGAGGAAGPSPHTGTAVAAPGGSPRPGTARSAQSHGAPQHLTTPEPGAPAPSDATTDPTRPTPPHGAPQHLTTPEPGAPAPSDATTDPTRPAPPHGAPQHLTTPEPGAPAPSDATTDPTRPASAHGAERHLTTRQAAQARHTERDPVAPTVSVEGATPTTPQPASEAVGPPAPVTTERAVAAQLVHRIGTLRHHDDGTHELAIDLEPADLGRIRLSVTLEGGVVHVQIGAEAGSTHDLLRRALPELRAALDEAGLATGQLDVGDQLRHRDERPGTPERAERAEQQPGRARRATATSSVPGASHGVDVLL